MLGKIDFAKSSLAYLLEHLIFHKAACSVKVLASRSIHYRLVLDEFEIILEVLSSFRVE
jgi:hypothetical protein